MEQMKKRVNDIKDLKDNLFVYKLNSKYGRDERNNRNYDFFHVFATDYNSNDIKRITQDYEKIYFPKEECKLCSGNQQPRPMDCYDTEECPHLLHFRGSGKKKEVGPLMECRQDKKNPLSIFLSRANLRWLLDHPELEFIVRTTLANRWVLHHITLDKFNDSPGMIKIVYADWHLDTHGQLECVTKKITNLEASLTIKKDEKDEKELIILKKVRDNLIHRLTTVEDDPDIMRVLYELNDRIKIGAI